jgi:hypothetical protein
MTTWTTKTGTEEWEIRAEKGRVIIVHCTGPFRLPTTSVSIAGDVAHTIAKDLRAAQKLARNQVK